MIYSTLRQVGPGGENGGDENLVVQIFFAPIRTADPGFTVSMKRKGLPDSFINNLMKLIWMRRSRAARTGGNQAPARGVDAKNRALEQEMKILSRKGP